MLKQPSGTNHFQFRFHQFGFAVEEMCGFCSTELFYFEREAPCNRSLRRGLTLTHSVLAMQDARHETTTLSPNYFRGRADHAHGRLREHDTFWSSRAGWYWTNSLGTVWTINADGTFHVVATTPKAEIWGKYTVTGDTITIQETRRSTAIPKNCKEPGVYKFSRANANTLTFVLVSDVCKPRIQNVTRAWTKK